ncbi:DEAD/DEAH box helicase family protein [Arthrobacter sp. I2-34]|uniref:DEAD/DEAH box helicase family protein n=1 Tax=Arthrobacter hankyongi TaxID=2904801 RepID=A0ABS9LDB7_9MICC|nr:DEAD/DEAH box helicase family protein [Arthrobacter hankyongi]MCG2624691.1 DEAD/DEAH box helicase family protein [Arthrobacter hankyongi]
MRGEGAALDSNFGFLAAEWPELAGEAVRAERLARIDPRSSLMYSRRTLEFLVDWLFKADATLVEPYKSDLFARLSEPTFKNLAGGTIWNKMDLIRKATNKAVHSNAPVNAQGSEVVLREVFHVLVWLAHRYTRHIENRPSPDLAFNAALLSPVPKAGVPVPAKPKTADEVAKLAEELAERDRKLREAQTQQQDLETELEELRRQVAEAKKANSRVPDQHDYDEATTRRYLIDEELHWAGWKLDKPEDREFPVDTMPTASGTQTGKGFVDYVLWGADGLPLAVVEAKRTTKSPHVGQQQAKLYADSLERRFGRRPVMYYTNGYQHWVWDDTASTERQIQGFHSRDQLELMITRRTTRKPLAEAVIDNAIVERPYQHAAIRAVTETLEQQHQRKALVVMATGTGKTRTVVALTKLLQESNWVKRVLFLADRIALVNQAAKAFKTHLPGSSPVVLGRDAEIDTSRIHVATYPTMMNLINASAADSQITTRQFGIGHYDLIIVDEAHRSVYQKYRAIFEYFDSYLVGLTATPTSEVDHNTYTLFSIENDVPTFAYELNEAIEAGYLVPPRVVDVPLKFPLQGIRYDDLTDAEKEEWDSKEWDEDGTIPDEIDAGMVNSWLFNTDTVDKALEVLMTHGHKVAGGDRLGKTIIFAKNNEHAHFITKRFDQNYPEYKSHFARVITYSVDYAQTLIDDFSDKEKNPHIAVSVDMLDTGIDVPEVVNLVFFKMVRSKTKFWQMVGRGTRLCEDLYGPGEDKQDFFIFDLCRNAEYFNAELGQAEGRVGRPLAEMTFVTRVKLLTGAADFGFTDSGYLDDVRQLLRTHVAALPKDNFLVRPRLEAVERFSERDVWNALSPNDASVLENEVAKLATINAPQDTEEAKRFDLLMLRAQLAAMTEPGAMTALQARIQDIASALQDQPNVPAIAAHMPLIQSILDPHEWETVTPQWLETVRRQLRDIVHLIEKKRRKIVYTSFEDELGELAEIELTGTTSGVSDFVRYREKVKAYLTGYMDHVVIQLLRRNKPLTELHLQELERMLAESGAGSEEDLQRAAELGLGLFVRSLVGLEPEAVQEALAEFVGGTTLNTAQLHFVDLIVAHLTSNGVMDISALYESPFSDIAPSGPEALFSDAKIDLLQTALEGFTEATRAS